MVADIEKKVVRFDLWIDGAFDARLAQEPDMHLAVCTVNGSEEKSWAALEKAHVYHVSASKDELPKRWRVDAEFLA